MAERPEEILSSEVESRVMGVSTARFDVDHSLPDLSMLLEGSCHILRAGLKTHTQRNAWKQPRA